MSAHPHRWLFALLVSAVWLSTSHAVTLCVHEDHVGLEPSWATCCESASCCERAAGTAPSSEHAHAASGEDGCRDYTLTLGDDWAPDDPRVPALDALSCLAPALNPSELCPASLAWAPSEPHGVPPPALRPQRSPILRC